MGCTVLLALALFGAGEGKMEKGLYVWTDREGLHLRWTANEKPALFTGTVTVNGGAGAIERVNPMAGGWVDRGPDGAIVFSATATTGVDGADLALAPGTRARIEVQIDGVSADPSLIFVGDRREHPKQQPVDLRVSRR